MGRVLVPKILKGPTSKLVELGMEFRLRLSAFLIRQLIPTAPHVTTLVGNLPTDVYAQATVKAAAKASAYDGWTDESRTEVLLMLIGAIMVWDRAEEQELVAPESERQKINPVLQVIAQPRAALVALGNSTSAAAIRRCLSRHYNQNITAALGMTMEEELVVPDGAEYNAI
jgi:tellurite resistance protein